MKYILTLLLISFAFGQTDSLKVEFNINNYREFAIPLGFFLDYAEECYNDSSITPFMKRPIWNLWKQYEHKEPTFIGFINWLKK